MCLFLRNVLIFESVLIFDFLVEKTGYCEREDLFFSDLQQFLVEKQNFVDVKTFFLWLPEKGSHYVFTWPFLHFLTLPAAVAAKLLFQFKSDL